ncbi:hypothetical protein AJ80_02401 [Polytolypa hystricis UAMH7299]|uniref:Serine hydrolase domain-containing protein n=1 Tax=Polytolypa hystricis (strain UAMH7299) TaxID=1447883 RepID=A0A2B7YR21_POLH7|nr:hypothetical protein AJ80_02401 [Polytolypa hystricis UAMH7299]
MTSSRPSILCLHGSGTSAEIFQIQTIRLRRELDAHFNFVFLDGPIEAAAGPGVLPVFEGLGPYRSWMPRQVEDQRDPDSPCAVMPPETAAVLERAIQAEIARNGRGFVGVMGFSMGARLAAGLLLDQQQKQKLEQQQDGGGQSEAGSDPQRQQQQQQKKKTTADNHSFKFGIFVCGTLPPIQSLHPADETGIDATERYSKVDVPSLHVIGFDDPWYKEGDTLSSRHFDESITKVFRFKMGHHFPINKEENAMVINEIFKMEKEARSA